FSFFFFFSSRRRHTRFSRDWSSDVCSSDLVEPANHREQEDRRSDSLVPRVSDSLQSALAPAARGRLSWIRAVSGLAAPAGGNARSEERRVGKECRYCVLYPHSQ